MKELGYEYEEHKVAQNLYGYAGDKRTQTANIIIRRQYVGSAANDVGFHKTGKGKYELIISEYDKRSGSKSEIDFLQRMKQIYSKHVTVKQLKKMGISQTSITTSSDGRIKIKARA